MNFASELSDLRHRHGFQVILVHGNHTSSALLQHAHSQVAFQEITADLPPRMLVKAQVGPTDALLGLTEYLLIYSVLNKVSRCCQGEFHFSVDWPRVTLLKCQFDHLKNYLFMQFSFRGH